MTASENPRKSTPRRGRRYIRRLGTRQKQIGLSVTSYELYIRSARFIPSYEQKRHHSSSISCLHRLGALPTDGAPTPLRRSFMAEGRLHRHDVFCTQFKNAFLRQSKNMKLTVGVVAKWDAALHGKVWAHTHSFRRSGCGKRSHDKFDTTLITTETTPISLGLLKPRGATYHTLLL